jgi:hypothetical protein
MISSVTVRINILWKFLVFRLWGLEAPTFSSGATLRIGKRNGIAPSIKTAIAVERTKRAKSIIFLLFINSLIKRRKTLF